MKAGEIAKLLTDGIETARFGETHLEYETTESPETENITTVMNVRFGEGGMEPCVSLNRLVEYIEKYATLGSIDLLGPPACEVVVHGVYQSKPLKIIFHLH